jgi:hypothetical protein
MKHQPNRLNSDTNPERWVLERAHTERNPIMAASVRLDKNIRQLQSYGEQMTDIPDLSSEIERIRADVTSMIDTHYLGNTGTWIDIYRLITKCELLEQSIYTPLLFRYGNNADHIVQAGREALINGLLGVHAKILASALEEYSYPDATDEEKAELRGIINEHTAMALFNYDQDPVVISLPATTASDVTAKTDIVRYTATDTGYQTLPIQVKSSHPIDPASVTPEGGILVTGIMMGNTVENRLKTARAIVAEVANEDSAVRPSYNKHLVFFRGHFAATIDKAVNDIGQQSDEVRRLRVA